VDIEDLRRRCLERLKPLTIPEPFDLREFCAEVARWRGRSIVLLPVPLPTFGPCGLWIATDRRDYVCYQATTSRMHQEHIVLHELGHMLCEHSSSLSQEEGSGPIFAHLSPELVQRVLSRGRYTTEEEREAEMLASLVLGLRTRRPATVRRPTASEHEATILERIQSTIDPEWP
jgi:hypothetical protein